MRPLLVVGVVAAVTFLVRASFLAVVPMRRVPAAVERRLRLIGPAAIAAVLAMSLLTERGHVAVVSWPALAGCPAAFVGVRRTGDLKWAFVLGFPVVWALSVVTG